MITRVPRARAVKDIAAERVEFAAIVAVILGIWFYSPVLSLWA